MLQNAGILVLCIQVKRLHTSKKRNRTTSKVDAVATEGAYLAAAEM
jgi:hypothetical protein